MQMGRLDSNKKKLKIWIDWVKKIQFDLIFDEMDGDRIVNKFNGK